MRTINGIDEFESLIGQELGTSEWLTMDQDAINSFADVTGDHQWIHVDEARAAEGPYGATIVHGFFTLALIPKFSSEVFTIEGVSIRVNYGLNKVRFLQPVVVGSRLRSRTSSAGRRARRSSSSRQSRSMARSGPLASPRWSPSSSSELSATGQLALLSIRRLTAG